jgi:hypothetical protein
MIIPSTLNAIRFIAVYGHGSTFSVSHLILGHGYQQIGKSHSTLSDIYHVATSKVYAGYLGIENGTIKVASGGSKTLNIYPSLERDVKLESELNGIIGLKTAVLELFPLILANKIQHIQIAEQ